MANYTARDLVEMGTLPPKALEACLRSKSKATRIFGEVHFSHVLFL